MTAMKKIDKMLWIFQLLLAALFLFAGGMKLVMPAADLARQSSLPVPFIHFIGVAEVLGALGLVLPGLVRFWRVLTPIAASGLGIIMIGATVLSASGGPAAAALIPFIVGVIAVFIAYGRWRLAV
jgi:hypothetical protein